MKDFGTLNKWVKKLIKRFEEVEGDFREIPGVDDSYLISSEGVLVSIKHGVKVIKGYTDKDGYQCFKYFEDWHGKSKHYKFSRLVALAWIPNSDNKEFVLHNDGSRTLNTVENLRWGTAKENSEDAIKHGTLQKNRGSVRAKLNANKVIAIREAHAVGQSIRSIALEYGVERGTIRAAIKGNTWRHVA